MTKQVKRTVEHVSADSVGYLSDVLNEWCANGKWRVVSASYDPKSDRWVAFLQLRGA